MLTHRSSPAVLSARVGRYLAGLVAIPALVVTLAPLASAQTGSGTDPAGPRPPRLTDAQRTCLAQHGVSLPTPGQRLAPPTAQQRAAFKAAAQACGLPAPSGAPHQVQLTDAQRTCLAQHGVQPPPKDPPSGPPTAQQLAVFRAAAQACGLPAPRDLPPPPPS
jgi:hypothetical protein